jgi:hypothetical protein
MKYNLVLDLLNDKGAILGRQGVTFSSGWNIEFRDGKSVGVKTQTPQTITYPADKTAMGLRYIPGGCCWQYSPTV